MNAKIIRKDMKYFIRSVKYFFYFALLTSLIITALVLTGMADGNIETMFRGGYSAIWKIALFFAAVAAVYPKVGFISRHIASQNSWDDIRASVVTFMKERQYELESENAQTITFRYRSAAGKLTRMYEDRITITVGQEGLTMEGLRKDVFRLATGLEYKLSPQQE